MYTCSRHTVLVWMKDLSLQYDTMKRWYTRERAYSFFCQFCTQGRSDGGISVYIPPKSVYLNFFMWLFCHDFEIAMTS